ncbi:MAG: glycerol-3-phosphate 1-O-acyltransferase PlsY [Ruminococcaceae bacterium]|nr:glycerol-3-phosphate 1-O-acyltransferase PlsY [Oscillospiraceae bacterium]
MYGKWNLVAYINNEFGLNGTPWAYVVTVAGVLVCMIIPYLLGSLNFGLIISNRKYKDDIRTHGSGNAGTTNMLRTYGKGAAVATLLGDMLKAFVAVSIGYLVLDIGITLESGEVIRDKLGASIAGLFVMLGHVFPCFYKFKGGKGVATAGMVVLMLNYIVFLILMAIFLIIVIGTKYVSLGSIMGMMLLPIVLTAFDGPGAAAAISVLMALLVIWKHKENILRLREGKESKISFKSKKKPAEDTPSVSENEDEDDDTKFVKCAGCEHLIPISRKVCAYCNTPNPEYVPADKKHK